LAEDTITKYLFRFYFAEDTTTLDESLLYLIDLSSPHWNMLWSPPYYSIDFEFEEFYRRLVTMAAEINELEDIFPDETNTKPKIQKKPFKFVITLFIRNVKIQPSWFYLIRTYRIDLHASFKVFFIYFELIKKISWFYLIRTYRIGFHKPHWF
jgi:hypothetical protein